MKKINLILLSVFLNCSLVYADVTIKLWHHWGGNRVPLMEKQIRDFEKNNPGIKVEVSLKPWDNRLQILLTAIAAGDPPNVTMLGRQDIPSFVMQNALIPLDKWMKQDGISRDLFYSSEISGSIVNDKVYILPLPTGGARTLIWWNKKMFADAGMYNFPNNWAETISAAKKLTIMNGNKLERAMMRFNVKNKSDLPFLILLNANGGKWLSDDGKKILFNTPQGVAAMQFIIDVTNINGGYEEQEAFYSQTGEWENGPFYQNYEAAEMAGSWEYFKIMDYAPNLDFGVASVPYGPSGSPKIRGAFLGGWGYSIPNKASHVNESWKLVKWLTTEMDGYGACWFLQQQKRPSPMKACNEDPKSGEGNKHWNQIVKAYSSDSMLPISIIQPQLSEAMLQMSEQAVFGNMSAEEAVQWGAEETQALLDDFWDSQ